MSSPILITAFYDFVSLEKSSLEALQKKMKEFGEEHDMRGLVLLSEEGINGTVCGTSDTIQEWKALLRDITSDIEFKDSQADTLVFPRWFVKIRKEIVTIKSPTVHPSGLHKHLTPEEWDDAMMEEDVVVLDTRNDYETEIGVFSGAVDPNLKEFSEFPEYVSTCGIPKDKKVLMYCTGGIRCEKALIEMERQGFEHVYQLKGGILAYLKKFPHKKFEGECFVFDHRISVDQELKPSLRYKLCPHCGDPGDCEIECRKCTKHQFICKECKKEEMRQTCSKNCRNHLQRVACAAKS